MTTTPTPQEAMKQATEFFWLCELMEQDSHYHHGLPKYIAAKGRFELTTDPYKAARFADEELCRAVCTAAHTQGHLYVKPVEHGFITTLRAALAASQPEPVGINGLTHAEESATASVMGIVNRQPEPCRDKTRAIPGCKNRHQCWEPCGELGKSEEHAKVANQPKLKPCRSPYCECDHGKCTHPGFYDARHEPFNHRTPMRPAGEEDQAIYESMAANYSQPEPKADGPEVIWVDSVFVAEVHEHGGARFVELSATKEVESQQAYIPRSAHREAMAKLEKMNVLLRDENAKLHGWVNTSEQAAGLIGLKAKEALAKKDAALDACVEALERVEPQFGYGFYRPENPHDFHPDPESCSPEEIANHKAACEAYDAGTYSPDNGDGWVTPDLHITKAPWGIGSYEVRDPLIDAAIAKAKEARK